MSELIDLGLAKISGEYSKELEDIEKRLKEVIPQAKEEIKEELKRNPPSVQLPQDNHTLSQFAEELSPHFKDCEEVFYKPNEDCIVEIQEYEDKLLKQNIVGFKKVSDKRLLNIIESKVNTYILTTMRSNSVEIRKTPNEQTIKLLSANSTFIKSLHQIQRFLSYPMPFIDKDNKLIISCKGYDPRYQAYFTPDTPDLNEMDPQKAKEILNDIFSEFCFKNSIDKIMTLSYAITPMCRGLYHRPTARTPLYIIMANRERAGKDYLAGVIGIIYEGRSIDDTPIVTGDKSQNNNDELRKKLTSALKQGRRRLHSSNNKGFLNNAILEQFLTSEVWIDRELGHNNNLELNNEIDVSLSANMGITYTPDLWHRARPINLFYGEENPNDRVYNRADLWGYVKENRNLILSAVYTLIKTWVDAGCPKGKTPFTSFPEWARVVGGIMQYHSLGDPCQQVEDEGVGGDRETQSMKELFTFMGDYGLNDLDHQEGYTIADIRQIITEAQSQEQFEGFSGLDLSQKHNQIKFGINIKRFVGREFLCHLSKGNSKVRLIINIPNDRSARVKYCFKVGNVGNVGNDLLSVICEDKKNIEYIGNEPNYTTLPKQLTFPTFFMNYPELTCPILDFVNTYSEEILADALKKGEVFEVRAGYLMLKV